MRNGTTQKITLGGVIAALAVGIMSLGGMIPVATYICPMLCMLLCQTVLKLCGARIAWAWYGCVCVLSLLLGPDKEAAALYVFIGYYPIIRPLFDKMKLGALLKAVYFNAVILLLYTMLFYLFGMHWLREEYAALGWIGVAVMLLLGNVVFYLFDRVLKRFHVKGR